MKDFNGGYIVASQEAYDLLVNSGYLDCVDGSSDIDTYFIIVRGNIFEKKKTNDCKRLYINNGKLSWDKPTEETEIEKHCRLFNVKPRYEINSMEDLNDLPIPGEKENKMNEDKRCCLVLKQQLDAMEIMLKSFKNTVKVIDGIHDVDTTSLENGICDVMKQVEEFERGVE